MTAHFWDENQSRAEDGKFGTGGGSGSAATAKAGGPTAPDAGGNGDKGDKGGKSDHAGVRHVMAAGREADAALDKAHAALDKAGPAGKPARKLLGKAVSFLMTTAANAVCDLVAATTANGNNLNAAIEKRYGKKAAGAITAASKATSHMIGVDKLPPTSVIPGTTLLKKLPFLAVAEVVHQVRKHKSGKAQAEAEAQGPKSKRQQKKFKHAAVKKANAILEKKFGKGNYDKIKDAEFAVGPAISGKLVTAVLAHVHAALDHWTAKHAKKLVAAFAPLGAAEFDFDSDKHPRAADGQFGPGGGGGGSDAKGQAGNEKPPAGGPPAKAPAGPTSGATAAAPGTAPTPEAARGRLKAAHEILKSAGARGLAGGKHLKESVSFLIVRTSSAVTDLDKTIDERYGHKPGMAIKAMGKAIGDLLPKMGGEDIMSDIDMEAVPSGDLLCTLPIVAVAEVARRIYKMFKPDAAPVVRSKTHEKRIKQQAIKKANEKIDRVAKSKGVEAPSPLKRTDFADDEIPKDVMKLARKAARKIAKRYAKWIKHRLPALHRDLAPLSGADFADHMGKVRTLAADLTAGLAAGSVPLREWSGRVAATFANVPLRAARAVWGTDPPPAARRLALAQAEAVRAHVAHFAARLDDCEEDWGRDAPRRADLYAQAGFSHLEEQRRLAARAHGCDAEARFCAEPCRGCPECVAAADAGWTPSGTLPPAGDCPCATNCRCQFRFRRAGAP